MQIQFEVCYNLNLFTLHLLCLQKCKQGHHISIQYHNSMIRITESTSIHQCRTSCWASYMYNKFCLVALLKYLLASFVSTVEAVRLHMVHSPCWASNNSVCLPWWAIYSIHQLCWANNNSVCLPWWQFTRFICLVTQGDFVHIRGLGTANKQ